MTRALLLAAGLLAAALALTATAATPAGAAPGPIQLVSDDGVEQALSAESPALSGDGRYVAFVGQIGGFDGIFRKDLATGVVVPVIVHGASSFPTTEASEPAISADGRYVSFTTPEPLDPTDDPAARTRDVYVADMATAPPTYELASARDGSSAGLHYASENGSVAAGRVSLSATGREVAFVVTAASDLTGAAGGTEAPAFQVAVRDLDTRRTMLISAERDPFSGADEPGVPVGGGAAVGQLLGGVGPGAALSADGSTVAWIGVDIPAQAPVTPAEASSIADREASGPYTEPLWRRVPGPAEADPPTRRLIDASSFPEVLDGTNGKADGACPAPTSGWDLQNQIIEAVPGLSADGDEVALAGEPGGYADAFLFHMAGAPTAQRLTRATPTPLNNGCVADVEFPTTAGSVTSVAISADGTEIAFTTNRQSFPLAPPALIDAPPTGIGPPELYLVDVEAGTMRRLTHGATPSEPSRLLESPLNRNRPEGARAVSFDADGEDISFASRASNLVAADGNGGSAAGSGSDAFLIHDPHPPEVPGASRVSAPPPALRTAGRWALTARAVSKPDGSVRVAVGVPGAGHLSAAAAARHPKRRVATARRRARLASVLVFVLHPARRLRRAIKAPGGLEADLRIGFRGPGGKPLHDLLHVRFYAHEPKKGGKHR